MNEQLERYLTEHGFDDRAVREAAAAYVATRSGYLGESEMETTLRREATDAAAVDAALDELQRDADIANEAALRVLASAWQSGDADAVRSTLESSKQHLELITGTALAIAILYGLYLLKPPLEEEEIEEETTRETTPQGARTETTRRRRRRKYRSFSETLKSAFRWLGGDGGN